jgi:hypothetical protein
MATPSAHAMMAQRQQGSPPHQQVPDNLPKHRPNTAQNGWTH